MAPSDDEGGRMQPIFESWTGIGRTVLVGTLGYIGLVVLLRMSGKRTLSKMNAFDLVVTVALGSTLATITLAKNVALVEGLTAYAVLIGLQFSLAGLSVRVDAVNRLVKSEPRLLLYHGHLLPTAMRRERVVEAEVIAALRHQAVASIEAADAVVLETNGTLTVIHAGHGTGRSTLNDVAGSDRSHHGYHG
jgi:uncharacterized membrane protein YcaP (DUF421 family)